METQTRVTKRTGPSFKQKEVIGSSFSLISFFITFSSLVFLVILFSFFHISYHFINFLNVQKTKNFLILTKLFEFSRKYIKKCSDFRKYVHVFRKYSLFKLLIMFPNNFHNFHNLLVLYKKRYFKFQNCSYYH